MLASLSDSTIKQYSRPLRSWWIFCQQQRIPPFCPSVTQALEFLAMSLENVASYSSLNTMRSALSLISQNEIGSHPAIRRFCKGVAALRPPRPRYDYVWDPAPVIARSISSIFPHDLYALDVITKKLVLLLALATGHRAQSLVAIRLSQISLLDKLIIRIPDRIKNVGAGAVSALLLLLPFFQPR